MQYKCETCYDTGSRDQIGTYLDCNECDVAQTRRDLNDFVKSLGPTHPEDVALAIHQRALAMAPKQEVPEGWKPEIVIGPSKGGYIAWGNSFAEEEKPELVVITHADYKKACECIAAPAVANGALTDERIFAIHESTNNAESQILAFARAIVAAAGPDAALVKALERIARWHGEFPDVPNEDGTTSSYAVAYGSNGQRDYMRQVALAALSGAKGN